MKTSKAIKNFYEDREFSPSTKTQYDEVLAYLEELFPELSSAKTEKLRRALKKISEQHGLWVRDAFWKIWSSFFHWCHLEYGIDDPMERVERNKPKQPEMRFLNKEETARLIAAANSLFEKAICLLGIGVGVRASEFGRIRIQDIDNVTIWLHGKGGKVCRVPLRYEVHQILEKFIDTLPDKNPRRFLFTYQNGKPISRYTVYRIVRGCMDRAGISGPKRGPHCLRHTLGSLYNAKGGNIISLQQMMRHSNISTTRKYVHVNLEAIIEDNNKYNPIKEAIQGSQLELIPENVLQEAEDIVKNSPNRDIENR